MRRIISSYSPGYFVALTYMLQSTEYQVGPYLAWYWRTTDFRTVMRRRTLDKTRAAKGLLLAMSAGAIAQIIAAVAMIILGTSGNDSVVTLAGVALFLTYPVVWAHLVVLPLLLGRQVVVKPREQRLIARSKVIFANHPGTIIGVAGSYGKTTMKELLITVLSEGKKVAATPANKNVAVSHAKFAATLDGDEDVLILEYGEGQPGDVAKFAQTTRPNIGIITGIAPAHLDQFPSLDAAAKDIFALANYLDDKNIYVNADAPSTRPYIKQTHTTYGAEQVGDWVVSDIEILYTGTTFTLRSGKEKLELSTALLGRHQVGPLAAVAVLGLQLGLTSQQIEAGIRKTVPHEHRMQPRQLSGGWIIDDTYNGNIEGIRAGLDLLATLPAKRKIYVTPGLVDQGVETQAVHTEIGQLIATANPDKVVLMQNSVTTIIADALAAAGYSNELVIEHDPLNFYVNIDQIIANGDLVILQNDWTDNYS